MVYTLAEFYVFAITAHIILIEMSFSWSKYFFNRKIYAQINQELDNTCHLRLFKKIKIT